MRSRRIRLQDLPGSEVAAYRDAHQLWSPTHVAAGNNATRRLHGPPAEEHQFFHLGRGHGLTPTTEGHGLQGNEQGNLNAPGGDGRMFFGFHRYFLRRFEDWLGGARDAEGRARHGHAFHRPHVEETIAAKAVPEPAFVPLPAVDPRDPVPMALEAASGDWHARDANVSPDPRLWDRNPYDRANGKSVEEQDDPREFTSLRQFRSSHQIGWRVAQNVHSAGHQGYGGRLLNTESVISAPLFYVWHAWIDTLWARWQELAAPPPLLLVRGNPLDDVTTGIRMDLWIRDRDGLLHRNRHRDGDWTGWGGSGDDRVVGEVVGLQWGETDTLSGPRRVWLFARGFRRGLLARRWDGDAWREWVDVFPTPELADPDDFSLTGPPAFSVRGDLRDPDAEPQLHAFVRADSTASGEEHLWRGDYDGGAWSWHSSADWTMRTRAAVTSHGDLASTADGEPGRCARIWAFYVDGSWALRAHRWSGERFIDNAMWLNAGSEDPFVIRAGDAASISPYRAGIRLYCRGRNGLLSEFVPPDEDTVSSSLQGWQRTELRVDGNPIAFRSRPAVTVLAAADIADSAQTADPWLRLRALVLAAGTNGSLQQLEWRQTRWWFRDLAVPVDSEPTVVFVGDPTDLSGEGGTLHCFVLERADSGDKDWTEEDRLAIYGDSEDADNPNAGVVLHEPYVCALLYGRRSAVAGGQWEFRRLGRPQQGPKMSQYAHEQSGFERWPVGGFEGRPVASFSQWLTRPRANG